MIADDTTKAGTAKMPAARAAMAAWKSANQWYTSGAPAKNGTCGGKLPAFSDWAMERCTPRSLQLEPPAATPLSTVCHRPDWSARPTNSAATTAIASAGQSRRAARPALRSSPATAAWPPCQTASGIGASSSAATPNTVERWYPPPASESQ
jgi:hypothetical protein